MFLRKYWLPLSVFIVVIAGVGLYLLATRFPPKNPLKISKAVEPIEKPTAEVLVGDTSQGGHFHADGTWHEGPHDAPVDRPVLPPLQAQETPQFVKSVSDSQDVTIADRVRASGNVPDRDELKTMSDEQLSELIDESYEKMRELAPKMNNAMREWAKVVGDLTRHAKTREENDAILTENAHLVQPLREKMESAAWEYQIHSVTGNRAFKISSARFIRTHHPDQTEEFWADYWVNF